jgi:alkylation response protein AidB-like acyl-CoA dehydrogenase
MRFDVSAELGLFAESVRGALAGWQAPLEPAFGSWWDDRDDELAARVRSVGWDELWKDVELLGAAVAGGIELGRAVAPLSLIDEATLGAALCLDGRGRHAAGVSVLAVPRPGGGLLLAAPTGGGREATLDGTGIVRGLASAGGEEVDDAAARWLAWGAATLAYLAGLSAAAFEAGVAHAKSREQFGAPLGELPAVRARLADAAIACDGLGLSAWGAVAGAPLPPWDELAWAGGAVREVTAAMLQVHGAIGFALEGSLHRHFRRAKVVQVWTDAVLSVVR